MTESERPDVLTRLMDCTGKRLKGASRKNKMSILGTSRLSDYVDSETSTVTSL